MDRAHIRDFTIQKARKLREEERGYERSRGRDSGQQGGFRTDEGGKQKCWRREEGSWGKSCTAVKTVSGQTQRATLLKASYGGVTWKLHQHNKGLME